MSVTTVKAQKISINDRYIPPDFIGLKVVDSDDGIIYGLVVDACRNYPSSVYKRHVAIDVDTYLNSDKNLKSNPVCSIICPANSSLTFNTAADIIIRQHYSGLDLALDAAVTVCAEALDVLKRRNNNIFEIVSTIKNNYLCKRIAVIGESSIDVAEAVARIKNVFSDFKCNNIHANLSELLEIHLKNHNVMVSNNGENINQLVNKLVNSTDTPEDKFVFIEEYYNWRTNKYLINLCILGKTADDVSEVESDIKLFMDIIKDLTDYRYLM